MENKAIKAFCSAGRHRLFRQSLLILFVAYAFPYPSQLTNG